MTQAWSIRIIKRLTPFVKRSFWRYSCKQNSNGAIANQKVTKLLRSDRPFLVSRFGGTELNSSLPRHLRKSRPLSFWLEYHLGLTPDFLPYRETQETLENLHHSSGVFPATIDELASFSDIYLSASPAIDLLGSGLRVEQYTHLNADCEKVWMMDLNPFLHPESSWTRALAGKKILVVHPFVASIQHQLGKRDRIFDDPTLIPEAEFQFLAPPQAYGGSPTDGESWTTNLLDMKAQVEKMDFDVAILGCGAYGLPLGAHIKKIGKQAIHIGGLVQILFGIIGTRWEGDSWFQALVNEHWIRPLDCDKPPGFAKGERGQTPYW